MMPEMTCAECREHLLEYVSGTLSPWEMERVAEHLAGCADCRRVAGIWRAASRAMDEREQRIPAGISPNEGWEALRTQMRSTTNPAHRTMHTKPTRAKKEGRHMQITRRRGTQTVETRPWEAHVLTDDPRTYGTVQRRQPRWRPVAAVAAVVVLGVISAVLFSTFGSQRNTRGTTPPQACTASQLKATLPANASVADVSMIGAGDGWAVGEVFDASQYTVGPRTLLVHYANCTWTDSGAGMPAGIANARLTHISMGTASDGWAFGETLKLQTIPQAGVSPTHEWVIDQPFMLHFTGGEWHRVALQGATAPVLDAMALRMISADEGWMLLYDGKQHTDPYTSEYGYGLLHYQHGAWTDVPLSFKTPSQILSGLATVAPDDCWLDGYDGNSGEGLVAHYANGTWSRWEYPSDVVADSAPYPPLYALAMTSPRDVWAAGSFAYHDVNGDHTGPFILHYDGTSWKAVPAPSSSDIGHAGIVNLSAVSPSEEWAFMDTGAVGPTTQGLPVLHRVNGAWQWQRVVTSPQIVGLSGLTMTSATQGWAVGAMDGRSGSAFTTRGVLVFYEAGTWTVIAGQQASSSAVERSAGEGSPSPAAVGDKLARL